jgi:hypothetical protein
MKPFAPRFLDANLVLEGFVFVIAFSLCDLVHDKCLPGLLLGAYGTALACADRLQMNYGYSPLLKIPMFAVKYLWFLEFE